MSINYNDEKRDPVTNFSDFIRHATPEEKEKVYTEVMRKTAEQMEKRVLQGDPKSKALIRGFLNLGT